MGCHCVPVITAITARDTHQIKAASACDMGLLVSQAQICLDTLPVSAFKIGFLGTVENVEAFFSNTINILYVAPERMMQPSFIHFLKQLKISIFAIDDEAHCVSMWGHDLRPHYQQLSQLTTLFPDIPRIA